MKEKIREEELNFIGNINFDKCIKVIEGVH
jgi:hypothetical protein